MPDHDGPALPDRLSPSAPVERLVESVRDYARGALSNNTARAYAADWVQFNRWCQIRGAEPLPSEPAFVGLCIADLTAPEDGRALRHRSTAPWDDMARVAVPLSCGGCGFTVFAAQGDRFSSDSIALPTS